VDVLSPVSQGCIVSEYTNHVVVVGADQRDRPESRASIEPYASPEEAADFLKIRRLKVIRMARSGVLPAHPLGTGRRRQWRFKLSELDKYMQRGIHTADPPVRQ